MVRNRSEPVAAGGGSDEVAAQGLRIVREKAAFDVLSETSYDSPDWGNETGLPERGLCCLGELDCRVDIAGENGQPGGQIDALRDGRHVGELVAIVGQFAARGTRHAVRPRSQPRQGRGGHPGA